MSKGFSKLDNPNHEGKTNTWLTPIELVEMLGEFDLDPCAYPRHLLAKKMICLPEDGLKTKWEGRVWLNPPYGRNIGLWLQKIRSHGNGIAIVFSRTETNWFQDADPDAIFLIKGRIKFINPEAKTITTNAGHGSCLLIYGKENIEAVRNCDLKGILISEMKI